MPSNDNSKYDFFLAHTGKDADKVIPLYDILSRSHRVFLDRKSIQNGENWNIVLPEALQNSKVIVPLFSNNYTEAYYLQEEVARAVHLQRNNPDLYRIVPVYLEGFPSDLSKIPYGLFQIHSVDLVKEQNLERLCRKLIGYLEKLPAKNEDSYRIKDELSFEHVLHEFPEGPAVEGSLVSIRLIEAVAESVAVFDSLQVIDEANAFRKQADPTGKGAITIKKIYLPDPARNPPKIFWLDAFVQARLHGPRMLAALLLTVDDRFFTPETRNDKYKLLAQLKMINN